MLQKLDTEHLNRLALAEALANMEPRDFDMRRPDRCICGQALRVFGIRTPYFGGWESRAWRRCKLARSFHRPSAGVIRASQSCKAVRPYTHPQDAARVMRYLAATDTVDWSVAGKL